ncbi:MAG: CPBP family intramembrane glutamic endopeptidase [Candidatus Bilamarchaeaceae archaeon]
MKKLFFFLFVFAFLFFVVFFVFYHDTYIYEAFLHLCFFSLSLVLLWEERDDIKTVMKKMGVPPSNVKKTILFSVGGFVLVMTVMLLLSIIFSYLGIKDNEKVFDVLNKVPFWILPFAVIVAPITEELLFRAALVPRIGIIGSSFAFGILHIFYGSFMEVVGTIAIGFVLGFIYKKSESIIPPIAIHLFFNLLTVLALLYAR